MAVTSAQVQELYVGLLGRAADKQGLDYWLGELNASGATLTLENVRANFVNEQPEYAAIYGDLSRSDTIVQVYSNLFGRAPDAAGLTYWSTGGGASVNVDQLVVAFINAASTSDKQALTNKVVVSEVYSSTVGTNFVKADAASIVSGVNANAATVSTALGKLTDGSLSGVAVPTGVAQLQAQAAAVKAQADFQASKVADLNKLSADLVAAAKAINPADNSVTKVATTSTDTAQKQYADLAAGLSTELGEARVLVGSKTTAQLEVDAAVVAKTLTDARTALTLAENGYAAKASAYEAAYKAAAAVKAPTLDSVTAATQVLGTATAVATAEAKDALVKALNATGVLTVTATSFDTTNAAATIKTVYDELAKATTTAQVKSQIDAALQSFSSYSTVKGLAAQQADFNAKTAAVSSAKTALEAVGTADTAEANFIGAVKPAADAAAAVEGSKALDALATQIKAITDGNAALTASVTKAGADLTALKNLVDIKVADVTLDADTLGGTNDLFYFGNDLTDPLAPVLGLHTSKDVTISHAGATGLVKGIDAIYLGEGFVKGTATVNAAGKIAGGNDGAKEVFFFQKGNDTYVVAETKTFGSSTVVDYALASNTDEVTTIVLTGVGIENVSFANGVVTIA